MRIARPILPGILAAILSLPCAARCDEVSLADQQVILEHFRTTFVYPQFTHWQFDDAKPYELGGTLVCGQVNFQNSNRVFMGAKPFYSVVRDGRYMEGGIVGNKVQDPAGTVTFAYDVLCKRH
jgi:hypothetical protein